MPIRQLAPAWGAVLLLTLIDHGMPRNAAAQSPGTSAADSRPIPAGPLTLERVLELAEARSESIAVAQAGVRRAEGELLRARSGRLPQLSAVATYDRALASEFEGLFDGSTGPVCAPFALDPAAPLEARVGEIERAIDCGAIGTSLFGGGPGSGEDEDGGLPFGRRDTWRVNLAFSQSVYSGGRLRALTELAGAARDHADLALTSSRAHLLFEVTQAFYDAALGDRLVSIAEGTIAQAEATFQQVQAGYKTGRHPEFELLRARVTRDNQNPSLIRQRANRDIAILRLKQMLDLPAAQPVQLAAALELPTLPPPAPFAVRLAAAVKTEGTAAAGAPLPMAPAASGEADVDQRLVVREAGTQVRLREAALSAARAERMPSVAVNSSYGRVAYPSGFVPGFDGFRTNWTVGASVQLPILTGGRLRGGEVVAQAELEQSRLQLRQTEELAALDTRSAWAELTAARAVWEASAGTIEQATRAHQIAEVRYRAGVSTQLELSDARLLLQQSETTRAQAARDLQIARARVALLPDLPLSAPRAMPVQPPMMALPSGPPSPAVPGGGPLGNASAQLPSNGPGGRQ